MDMSTLTVEQTTWISELQEEASYYDIYVAIEDFSWDHEENIPLIHGEDAEKWLDRAVADLDYGSDYLEEYDGYGDDLPEGYGDEYENEEFLGDGFTHSSSEMLLMEDDWSA